MTMTRLEYRETSAPFTLKDPLSALTHFGGFIASIIGLGALLIRGSRMNDSLLSMTGYAVFMGSMIILYGASSAYHAFNISPRANMRLKKMDHCSIFLLIAGSYTPLCLCIHTSESLILLAVIWGLCAAGIVFKLCFVTCPKWVSSLIYITMGWLALLILPDLLALGHAFDWLLAGGIIYSIGGLIYALKPALFPHEKETGFGNHELFHCFVLAGSFCHFIMVYQYLTLIG